MVPSPAPGPGPGVEASPDLPHPQPEPHTDIQPQPCTPISNGPIKYPLTEAESVTPTATAASLSKSELPGSKSKPSPLVKPRIKLTIKKRPATYTEATIDTTGSASTTGTAPRAKRVRFYQKLDIYHSYEKLDENETQTETKTEAEFASATTSMEKVVKRRPGRPPRDPTAPSPATSSDESSSAESHLTVSRNVDGTSTFTVTLPVHKEIDGLKGSNKPKYDINKLESYALHNVNVEAPQGLTPDEAALYRNILRQVKPGSTLKVTGLLEVGPGPCRNLKKHPIAVLNQKYIMVDDIQLYSIGYNKDDRICQLWVLGRAGWYELHPRLEYREIFEDMKKAIAMKFFIDDWFYGDQLDQNTQSDQHSQGDQNIQSNQNTRSMKVWKTAEDEIFDILRGCSAFISGDGGNVDVWTTRCREYQHFFLSQMDDMDKNMHQSILKESSLYQWISGGAPDLQSDAALAHKGPEPDPPFAIDFSTSGSQESPDSDTECQIRPYHGHYISNKWPQGTPNPADFSLLVATLLSHYVDNARWKGPGELSVNTIHTVVYKDFNVHYRTTCKILVSYFAKKIISLLPKEYEKYDFYKALAESHKDYATCRQSALYINDGTEDKDKRKHGEEILALFDSVINGRERICRRNPHNMSSRNKKYSKKASPSNSTDSEPESQPAQLQGPLNHVHPDTLAIIQPTMEQQHILQMTNNQFKKHILARVRVRNPYEAEDESTSTTDSEEGGSMSNNATEHHNSSSSSKTQTPRVREKSATRGRKSGRGRGRGQSS